MPKPGTNGGNGSTNGKNQNGSANGKRPKPRLSPQQLAVIAGLLSNALIVESVLVDKDQQLQIVLSGTLRRKSRTDRLIEELRDVSVGDLIKSLLQD
ncbi:hypothetical protein [Paenibacillus turpanensis]|uniref:hypothetical protein n=1 Tax=Paenibacillus turpanensis TaxID=2689078 RepID=UPI00140C6B5A|nr:hypothetical protein [Paenibacillus turpanensis]